MHASEHINSRVGNDQVGSRCNACLLIFLGRRSDCTMGVASFQEQETRLEGIFLRFAVPLKQQGAAALAAHLQCRVSRAMGLPLGADASFPWLLVNRAC